MDHLDSAPKEDRIELSRDASKRLLDWYRGVRRDLPWRRSRDPYRIWVSEVMLQQTRVETTLPYYERFLERFPDVAALAAAEEDDVLAAWSGLGYYRRARMLHRAARQVVAGGGEIPRTAAELRLLPGVGEYTAAAVASIAFDEPVPVVDGNVERVAARLVASRADPKKASGRARVVAVATALLDPSAPGDSNQALMELGATVCIPRRPRCELCPLSGDCRAAAEGSPQRYPPPRTRRAITEVAWLAALVERRGEVLLFRRDDDCEVLAGTWELPWVELGGDDPSRSLGRRYGGQWRLEEPLGEVAHGITHRRIRVSVRRAALEAGEVAEGPACRWVPNDEIGALPTSSLVAKILAL